MDKGSIVPDQTDTTDIAKRERTIAVIQAVGFIVILVVLGIMAWRFGWYNLFIGDEGVYGLTQVIDENLPRAIAIYIGALVIGGVLLAIPGFLFAIAAGALFGPVLGTIVYVVGATIAAVISFLAARTFLKDFVKPIAMRNKLLKRWLFDEIENNAILVLFVTRIFPVVPYNIQNFAYGTTDVDLFTYTWCTALFAIPAAAFYAFAAAGATDESQRILYLAVAAILAVAIFVIVFFLNRKYGLFNHR